MEEIIFQIYGTLLLTLTGFVLPLLTIALSLFPEGVKVLSQTYENERKQAEKNLEEELKKKSGEGVDYDTLSKNIATLKVARKKAARKLFYINPSSIVSRSAVALGISLISFIATLLLINKFWLISYITAALSICSLGWALLIFRNSIGAIIEASSAVQNIRRQAEEKTLELLTALVDNSKVGDPSMFIEHKHIKVLFNKEEIIQGKEYVFSVNKEYGIQVALINQSEYMFKTAELGFILPSEFLIKETSNISSTYTEEKTKIIRFTHNYLQSNVHHIEGEVFITFLKAGVFDVSAFVKGENLKNKIIKFRIRVIE